MARFLRSLFSRVLIVGSCQSCWLFSAVTTSSVAIGLDCHSTSMTTDSASLMVGMSRIGPTTDPTITRVDEHKFTHVIDEVNTPPGADGPPMASRQGCCRGIVRTIVLRFRCQHHLTVD